MTRADRLKALENAAAVAAQHAFLPAAVRVGVAALVEEAKDARERLDALERAIFSGVSNGG